MKHLVINPFIDKVSLVGYSEGDMYESTDSKRISFLQESGFLKKEPNVVIEKKDKVKRKDKTQ
jgi:hypothetical protein